ncbi:MAG: hypothetical protein JO131_08110 [Gammaproteobacteria bacterium]|nr:hypothetical protein [Gammaproteobacteria bacterium]
MENDHPETINNVFSFLEKEEVQEYFADLNIALLRGRHIQKNDYHLFHLLNAYQKEFANYYKLLYNLLLEKDRMDNEIYYYLDFPIDGRGKLADYSRHKELTEKQIVIGLMLLNMYYDRFFENPKEINWIDIKKEITEGESSSLYKKLLFNHIRDDYSDQEWSRVTKLLRQVLKKFETLGWIQELKLTEVDELRFTLRESIHRLAKLYKYEIENFDEFIKEYNSKK